MRNVPPKDSLSQKKRRPTNQNAELLVGGEVEWQHLYDTVQIRKKL